MPVEDPGDFQVVCDVCGNETSMLSTQYAGNPRTWGVSDDTIEEAGWRTDGDRTHCPDCKEEEEDE